MTYYELFPKIMKWKLPSLKYTYKKLVWPIKYSMKLSADLAFISMTHNHERIGGN